MDSESGRPGKRKWEEVKNVAKVYCDSTGSCTAHTIIFIGDPDPFDSSHDDAPKQSPTKKQKRSENTGPQEQPLDATVGTSGNLGEDTQLNPCLEDFVADTGHEGGDPVNDDDEERTHNNLVDETGRLSLEESQSEEANQSSANQPSANQPTSPAPTSPAPAPRRPAPGRRRPANAGDNEARDQETNQPSADQPRRPAPRPRRPANARDNEARDQETDQPSAEESRQSREVPPLRRSQRKKNTAVDWTPVQIASLYHAMKRQMRTIFPIDWNQVANLVNGKNQAACSMMADKLKTAAAQEIQTGQKKPLIDKLREGVRDMTPIAGDYEDLLLHAVDSEEDNRQHQ